jgi:hypothetical protein
MSEILRIEQGSDQVDQQAGGDDSAEEIEGIHGRPPGVAVVTARGDGNGDTIPAKLTKTRSISNPEIISTFEA